MAPHNDRFLPPSHAQKVRRQKERELDLDLDGDGLTVREELKYGLHPYASTTATRLLAILIPDATTTSIVHKSSAIASKNTQPIVLVKKQN
jgi:hypothetical protein